MQGEEDNWMPLESNPEVINPFISKMGLKTHEFSFQEMMSIEEWALQMLPSPVLGIMLCYEMSPAQLAFKNEQADGLNPEAVPKDIFYMKQFAHNACGTIALFHIILNNMGKHPGMVTADSYIEKFKNSGLDKDPQ
jgi:ubiquitin carboxyl-terminal hydrolase L3